MLRRMNGTGVIRLFEVFESVDFVYLVLEHLGGEKLFSSIKMMTQYSESKARIIMKKILEVVDNFHSMQIVLRDLNPENLILSVQIQEHAEEIKITVINCGIAVQNQANKLETLYCGTPGYIAPEIFNKQGYGLAVDIFSCGVILYSL